MGVLRSEPFDSSLAVLERLPVVVLDDAGATRYVSPTAATLFDADPESPPSFDEIVAPADADAVARAFLAVRDGSGADSRVQFRAAGDATDAVFEATLLDCRDASDFEDVVVSLTNVTGAERLRRRLQTAIDPSGGLATARTPGDVVERLSALTDGIPDVAVGCYLRDRDTATLRPVRESATGEAEPPVREAARTGEVTLLESAAFPLAALPRAEFAGGVAVPLGDRGVLVAGARPAADVTPDLFAFLRFVAATATLALDRLEAHRAFRRAVRTSDHYRECLDRQTAGVDLERRAERRVLAATSETGVREAVCDELATADPVAFAWSGTVSPDGDVVPRATAGEGREYLSSVSFSPDGDDDPPATRVVHDRTTVLEGDVSTGFESADWRREALDAGFRSVLAVPIGGDDATHGVIVCYGRERDAFDGPVGDVVEHLTATVEYALTSVELREMALGNTTVELVLSVPTDDALLPALADATGGTVRFESATVTGDETTRIFVTVDAPPEVVVPRIREIETVVEASHLGDRDDGVVLEVVCDGPTVPGTLAELGAVVTDAETTDDGVRITVTVSRNTPVREFVDSVRETYPGTTLLARRTTETPFEANLRFRRRLEASLTERQLETLQTAHYGGYFDSPRSKTGSDIAAMLGITQPTFASHLREAQHRLLSLLFETT